MHSQEKPASPRPVVLNRLAVRLHEATDELAVLATLDGGLHDLGLVATVARLDRAKGVRVLTRHRPGQQVGTQSVELPAEHFVSFDAIPLVARAVQARETIHTRQAVADLGILAPPSLTAALRPAPIRAICAPMVSHARTTGVLIVWGDQLAEDDREIMSALANHLAVALENTTVLRDLRQMLLREHAFTQQLQRLERLISELAAEHEPRSVERRAVDAAAETLGSERVALFLAGREDPGLRLVASAGLSLPLGEALAQVPLGEAGGAVARVLEEGTPVVIPDTQSDPAWLPGVPVSESASVRALWAVPLMKRQGERLGVLAMFSERPGSPAPEQLNLAQRFAQHAALAIAASQKLERQTMDTRTATMTEMSRSIPHELGQPLAIISGYAELIAEGLLEGERLREACRELVGAAANLSEMIQRLERVTRYVTKNYGPGRTMIDFERAADEAPDEPEPEAT